MKLIIESKIFNIKKEVKNPKFIPRIGEKIFLGYAPAFIITDILHVYDDEETVYIQVK